MYILIKTKSIYFKSNFDKKTVALDGHKLFYTTTSSTEKYVSYSSPVKVNGEKTTLKFVFVWDETMADKGYYMIAGIWKGYDENGLPDNDIVPLQKGDIIQVVTDVVRENGENIENYSEEFIIGDDRGKIEKIPLDCKEYQYVFVATDIFGNIFTSDMATFKNGKITNIEKF